MKDNRALVVSLGLLLSIAGFSANTNAAPRGFVATEVKKVTSNGQRKKIPRKAGAVHEEFVAMLQDLVEGFHSGVGRIELVGLSAKKTCHADLFLGADSSYIALYVDDLDYAEEFYLDHPALTFKDILFQYRVVEDKAVSLVVNKKKGQYLISRRGDQLSILVETDGRESPECRFGLSDARVFDGETE